MLNRFWGHYHYEQLDSSSEIFIYWEQKNRSIHHYLLAIIIIYKEQHQGLKLTQMAHQPAGLVTLKIY